MLLWQTRLWQYEVDQSEQVDALGSAHCAEPSGVPSVSGVPRIFARGRPEKKFSYIMASRLRNINLT